MMARAASVAAIGTVMLVAGGAGWLRPSPDGVAASASMVKSDGALLFQAKGCSSCHDGPDSTARIGGFPSLAVAPVWAGTRRAGISAHDYLTESIRRPSAFISPAFEPSGGPTGAMPDLAVSDTEVEALVAYLMAR